MERIRAHVVELCGRVGFPAAEAAKVQLAVDEAAANVMLHSCGGDAAQEIEVDITCCADEIEVILRDRGVGFDPASHPPKDLKQHLAVFKVGGLGVHLMRTLLDEVEWTKGVSGNAVRMVKRVHDAK
ncbi:MAG: ATP-binding protein [Candidatus Schekmanbacteria bacterium]|nr:ATP-binding protein [Candidatus Schekmanbacteria bacterium]